MRWSKLKHLIEENFAPAIRRRIAINSAAYGACSCGHAWITFDGDLVANFCTRAYYNRFLHGNKAKDSGFDEIQAKRYRNQPVEYGEMSRQDIYRACWTFIHDLSFEDAIRSDDPLIQSLVVLDRRLGRRRISKLAEQRLHPLTRKLLELRMGAEQSRHLDGAAALHASSVA